MLADRSKRLEGRPLRASNGIVRIRSLFKGLGFVVWLHFSDGVSGGRENRSQSYCLMVLQA